MENAQIHFATGLLGALRFRPGSASSGARRVARNYRFRQETDGIPGLGVPNTTAATHCLADGWLGQYNRKHRKENEIAAFPRLTASQVCL